MIASGGPGRQRVGCASPTGILIALRYPRCYTHAVAQREAETGGPMTGMALQPLLTLTELMLYATCAVGIAGLVWLVRMVYGERTGDHPVCMQCGYDLHGLPAQSQRCSECGVDITIAGAVVIGQRIRRKGKMLAVAVGTLCLVGGLYGGMLMLQTHHREV